MNTTERGAVIRNTLKFFLPSMVFIVIATVIVLAFNENVEMQAYQNEEKHTVNLQTTNLDRDIQKVSSDLALLAHSRELLSLWDDQGIQDADVLTDIAIEFLEVSYHMKLYDQIRLIDEEGMESIRVNFNNDSPFIVPQHELQDKKGRYYFEDAIKLVKNEIFVSPLDLNIEYGQVKQPIKPTIRFATPVFDQYGNKRGIILLNYLANDMLDRFSNHSGNLSSSQAMLVNVNGYWLAGPDPDKEWGFMFENRKEMTFANAYPEAWEKIKTDKDGQFKTTHGLFTFETIHPLLDGQKSSTGSGNAFSSSFSELEKDEYYWKVVSFIPKSTLYAVRNSRRKLAIMVVSILLVALFLGLRQIEKGNAIRKQADIELKKANKTLQDQLIEIKALESALREQAIQDPLTGLFNRRYMIQMLTKEISRASRNKKSLSVVFIDLDNFKEINDTYGHIDGGDKALQIFANSLKKACRAEDLLCRFGGDEFLVILNSTPAQIAYKRALEWKKNIAEIQTSVKGKEFSISFSAGIASFPDHCKTGESIIEHADKALYRAKELGRNQAVIYSDVFSQNPASSSVSNIPTPSEINASDREDL